MTRILKGFVKFARLLGLETRALDGFDFQEQKKNNVSQIGCNPIQEIYYELLMSFL